MKLTKYEHACLTLEKDDQTLVIDPGNFTSDFVVPENVVAIVVTHQHADHFGPDMLAAIYDKNPDSILIAHPQVVEKMPDHKSQTVNVGDTCEAGPFLLEFFGGKHATIHASMPAIANLGVMVDELVYYPGDSFTQPGKSVDVLALPIGAPWLKLSEAIDFLIAVKPRLAFPTHDAPLSTIGRDMADNMLARFAASYDGVYQRINTSIDL